MCKRASTSSNYPFKQILNLILLKLTYNLFHDRVQLISYDKEAAKDVHVSFGKVNRTASAFNVTFTLVKDLTDPKNIMVKPLNCDHLAKKLLGPDFSCLFK